MGEPPQLIRSDRRTLGSVELVLAPESRPPFAVQAVLLEEDRGLVLSASRNVRLDPGDHPIRIMTGLHDDPMHAPGTLVVRDGRPLRMFAVVHDLDAEPTLDEAWVTSTLRQALTEASRRGIERLGMQLLGSHHGRLDPMRAIELLIGLLEQGHGEGLERIWLMTPASRPGLRFES